MTKFIAAVIIKFFFKHANTHIALSKTQTRPCWAGLQGVDDLAVETYTVGPALPFPADICTQTHRRKHTDTHTSPAEQLPQGSGKLLPSPTQ